jgi:hypothetical protein
VSRCAAEIQNLPLTVWKSPFPRVSTGYVLKCGMNVASEVPDVSSEIIVGGKRTAEFRELLFQLL